MYHDAMFELFKQIPTMKYKYYIYQDDRTDH